MSLKMLLTVIFVMVASLPLATFWLWPQSAHLQREISGAHNQHLVIAEHLAFDLKTYHESLTTAMKAFGPLIAAGAGGHTRPIFENLHFRHLCVMEPETGRVVRTLLAEVDTCPRFVPEARRQTFIEISADGDVGFTGVDAPNGGEPRIFAALRTGPVIVIGAIRTTYFKQIQRDIMFGERGHAVIVDASGRVLAHPRPTWEAGLVDLSELSVIQQLKQKPGITTFYSPALETDMVAGFASAGKSGWGVIVPQPVSEIRDDAYILNVQALFVLAVGAFLSVCVGLFVAIAMSRWVGRMHSMTLAVAAGDGDAEEDLPKLRTGVSELDGLATSFASMAEKVRVGWSREVRLREIAEDASRSKSRFLATMSHEIRTPLNGVLGMAQLLETTDLDKRQKDYVQTLLDSGQTLLTVVNDVLDFSKIEAGHLALANEPFDISEPVKSVAKLFRPNAVEKGLDLVLELSEIPAPNVVGDATRVRQILLNLVGNAIKFTANGSVTIRLETQLASPSERFVTLTVEDTGIGIPEDRLVKIFNAFEQATSQTSREHGGTGLGLAICKHLAEAMGGTLVAESDGRTGSRFTLQMVLPSVMPAVTSGMESETQKFLALLPSQDTKRRRASSKR